MWCYSLLNAPMFVGPSSGATPRLALIGCTGILLQNRASLKPLFRYDRELEPVLFRCVSFRGQDPGYVKNFAGLIQARNVVCSISLPS